MALTAAGEAELKRLRAVAARPAQLPYAVRTGPMASVNQVRKDPDLWSAIEARGMRKIFAVEMEAATIATAAHQRDLRWLVVKGVMDHSNSEKNDNVKEFAARASAEVMFTLLTKFESAAATSRDPIAFGGVPGNIKHAFFRSLLSDWIDLAVRLDVPRHATYRFAAGEEPRQLWEWLEARGRLRELPEALDGIGRTELADLLRRYL
jgi:hypothetical protein